MSFIRMMCKAAEAEKRKTVLEEEKKYASSLPQQGERKESIKERCRHRCIDIRRKIRKKIKKCFTFPKHTCLYRFFYRLTHDGSCENYVLKSVAGFIGGFLITYIFFMFFVFQLNFKFSTATIMCSIFGSILTIGLAFSYKVRCIVFLTLPQLFSKRGRQALLAYAFILAITGPAKNTLNNMGILSESLACGQEQLKQAVKQIIEVIKKPFYAIRDAIKTVIKVVKVIVKKIKEILLAIKRVIVAIIKVIKAVFLFLAKIINVCNKEIGTPFQRCVRVFEDAVTDCRAKLGPTFSWLCSITYLAESVCYTVKWLDFICSLVDFISNNIVGVVVKKMKNFIRHIKTMFYVRIKFSHSFHFETNASKSLQDVATGIVTEVKQRTEGLGKIFNFMSCATSLFFMFIIVRVLYYRYKFLTEERFDNRFITKDFRAIDIRRAQLGKETVLPLNQRERNIYVNVSSLRLVEKERLKLSQSAVVLGIATLKLCTHMMADYALFWVLMLIRKHASFQSTFDGSKIPTVHVKGTGFFADLLKSIVKAFQPVGIRLEIDTVPCLPDPIPPDYDRYVQIASLLFICWILTLFEPYGLRWRHSVMCYYHPTRAKERAIWLYNQIMRTRSSFLKFARRQLRRKFGKDKSIAKVTCKEYLAANLTARFKIMRLCITPEKQLACLLCGEVFREDDAIKPIKCATPGCPGVYCEQCFQDLQNVCSICLDPIQYGDLSDISEEKDSSEDEPSVVWLYKKKKRPKCKWCKKICGKYEPEDDSDEDDDQDTKEELLAEESDTTLPTEKDEDSDYYSTDIDSGSFDYQYEKDVTQKAVDPPKRNFADLEKQRVPDYASMESFRKKDSVESKPPKTVKTESKEDSEDRGTPIAKKKHWNLRRFLFRRRKGQQEEVPLLEIERESSEDMSSDTSSETSYIESEVEGIKRTGKRKALRIRKKTPSDTETSYIETPKSSKRSFPTDIESPSDYEIPRKKAKGLKKSSMVPESVPKLNLDFDPCKCDNPACTRHPCYCEILNKMVKYHTEIETPSGNRSVRSVMLLSTTERSETSPATNDTTSSTSVHSSQRATTSPHETVNYLYSADTSSAFIDQNKSQPIIPRLKRPSGEGTASSTTFTNAYDHSLKKKIHDYYKKTHYDNTDNPKVKKKEARPVSKFTKFINRLLRKDIFHRTSTRPSLTKSFLSESDDTSSASLLIDQEQKKILATSNVPLRRSEQLTKSQYRPRNISTYFADLFYNIFMGGGSSTKHRGEDGNSSRNRSYRSSSCESDESFHVIAEKFGYYDSTDSEISELQRPVNRKKRQDIQNLYEKKHLSEGGDLSDSLEEEEESEGKGGKSGDRTSETELREVDYTEGDDQYDKYKSGEGETPSQMSIDRNRSSTRYSREPPERDHEDNLKCSTCPCRIKDCKRHHQECNNTCCPHRGKSNPCQNQYCPDRCPRTTYDLAKSAENLRQHDLGRAGSYNVPKRGQQSHSSPEVSKNRLPIKPNEMTNNDSADFMYNDYESSRSATKNDCYGQDHMKNRYPPKYPYEEPMPDDDYHNDHHERNCCCVTCRRISRQHYRNCKCYDCMRSKKPMDDQMSSYSDESQGLNLAYQKTEEYPVLVDEIENTISMRNKERVRKTMRQFELLSRQNKGLDKPIYDDDEDEGTSNRYVCNKRPPYNRPPNNEPNRSYCYDRPANYQSRSECLSERPAYAATPFPRNRGYVEKVARFMDPTMSDNTQKYPKFQNDYGNGGAKWQMDPRSGEWVKIYDGYDFENNYPPLPQTPPYHRDYDNYAKNPPCQNYYNAPSHRSASPIKHNMHKPCNCRNCMGNQGGSRY